MHIEKALSGNLGGAFVMHKIKMPGVYVDSSGMVHESKLIKILFLAYAALLEGGITFFRRLVFL